MKKSKHAAKHKNTKPKSKNPSCPFCTLPTSRHQWKGPLLIEIKDSYPVTKGHTLLITRRHVKSAEEASPAELRAIMTRAQKVMQLLRKSDPTISGFNLGFNVGESAGQTIPHLHFHIIPRRQGDHPNPRGGIRAVIPEKASY